LVVSNDDELASASSFGGVALVFGVVVEHFSAVGEELAGREDMLDPELVTKAIKSRPDALQRYTSSTSSTNGGEHGDVEVTGCFSRRVERHYETFVVAAHGPDCGIDAPCFRRPHAE
jgi:hypothetical protein